MHKDSSEVVHKCEACQLHAPVKQVQNMTGSHHFRPALLQMVDGHCWSLPRGSKEGEVPIVAVEYFTLWSEVKTLASITWRQVMNFLWESIICRYGLPGEIVTDNGKQIAEKPFSQSCKDIQIKKVFSSVAYP
ncbi:uncharacterized protein LOC143591988 [Bidens hawaiensis]|uniref:uncharacterized protein LOC143591988 n=1 Tax=Bidens hawaiensis TaxID=980011 RepID=UPI00404A10A8